VEAKNTLLYWSNDGIYAISYPDNGTRLIATNITFGKIQSLYQAIPKIGRDCAKGYTDLYNNKVYWAYCNDADADSGYLRQDILVYDLILANWSRLNFVTPDTSNDNAVLSIIGFTQDPNYTDSAGLVPIKLILGMHLPSTPTNYFIWTICEFYEDSFADFAYLIDEMALLGGASYQETETAYDAYIETWPDHLGDMTREKQAVWVFVYMEKTETGFEDLGDDILGALGTSSLMMRGQWEWHNSAEGGKWGTAREVYRHKRPYIPEDVNDTYDTGESLIITKNKVYGRGMSLALRFDAVDGENAILKGFAIPYTAGDAP
jgi:hypothetical protein